MGRPSPEAVTLGPFPTQSQGEGGGELPQASMCWMSCVWSMRLPSASPSSPCRAALAQCPESSVPRDRTP